MLATFFRTLPDSSRQAARIASIYAGLGVAWILVTDRAIALVLPSPEIGTALQTYKGSAFIAATAVLIFATARRVLARQARAVKELQASEARLKAYHEHAPAAIFAFDEEGRCLDANGRGADLIGCTRDEILALRVADIVPPGREALAAQAMSTLARGNWLEGEFQLLRRDGRLIWISTRAVRLDGNRFLAFAHDVSQRRATEEKLRLTSTVYEGAQEGVIITDPSGIILAVNPAFTAITGYAEHEVQGRTPRVLRSGQQSPAWYRRFWAALVQTGRWQGEIWNRRKNGEVYPEWLSVSAVRDDRGHIRHYVGLFSDLTRIKHTEAELDRLVHNDPVTDLPNRLLLSSRLDHAVQRARANNRQVAVLAIDIDRFASINETVGLDTGDAVLRALGGRLRRTVPEGETVGRSMADEFVAVLEDIAEPGAAALAAQRVLDVVAEPLVVAGHTVRLGCSIGISVFPHDGGEAVDLMRQASTAAAQAGRDGGRRFHFYTHRMTEAALSRLQTESALRQAMGRDEFVLFFQPQMTIRTGRIEGIEVLVRWKREGRLVSPGEFIAIAEDTGLIEPLGDWILRTACQQIKTWQAAGQSSCTVAINVSPVQVRDPGFADRVARIVLENGISPSCLELELTESALMEHSDDAMGGIRRLADLGLRFAIDDFGTGFSSLARLRSFPIDTLKIDRAFLRSVPRDPESSGYLRSIIMLGSQLHLRTVAEGVESADQLAFLADCGCEIAQGFHIGRPMPIAEFDAFLARRGLLTASPLSPNGRHDGRAATNSGRPRSPASTPPVPTG